MPADPRDASLAGHDVDVLIPVFTRPGGLIATLASLVGQTHERFRVVVSDQTEDPPIPVERPEVVAIAGVLRATGRDVELVRHLPRRGMAEHRQALLDRATARYALFLDADVVLEHDLVERLLHVIGSARCGFIGSAVVGASYIGDIRPDEEAIEVWPGGRVEPEKIVPEGPGWDRYRLHNAANLHHLRDRRSADGRDDVLYKVAWVGGCVLYDVEKLRSIGGFEFWRDLPPVHAGEDVVAQLRVMERYGGAGLFPSGAWHLELPTTIPDRDADAPKLLPRTPVSATGSRL